MFVYQNEKDMPFGEIKKDDGSFHHLSCNGSRRHVISWDSNGSHCSEPNCEINYKNRGERK